MRPHPRIRAAVQGGGLILTLLLIAAWAGSAWWGIHFLTADVWVFAGNGQIGYSVSSGIANMVGITADSMPAWRLVPLDAPGLKWGWTIFDGGWLSTVVVPLWSLTLAAALPTAAAWRQAHRARTRPQTHCHRCGYPRAGLAAGAACPECGDACAGAKP